MSRIGKKPVPVPSGVTVSINNREVVVEGKNGRLAFTHRPDVFVTWDESEKQIVVSIDERDAENRQIRAHWGTTRSIINGMIGGVTEGYSRVLEVNGAGWGAAMAGKQVELKVGFASPVRLDVPEGLEVGVEKNVITIKGADKQRVGAFAARVRGVRPPEPYNGKGIKYSDEVIQRKEGKVFGS
jgi:large subunit ribosomal protein L6